MRIPDHLTCLGRNLYTGQEEIVRTGHRTMAWFKIREGVCQGYVLSPCLCNFNAECVCVCVCVCVYSVVSDSLWSHGLYATRLLCPWDFPGKNTGVGCHFLLQGTSWPRDQTWVFHITGRCFTLWATREAQSASYEMTGWMNHKLESRLPGELSVPQICRLKHSNSLPCSSVLGIL